MCLKECLVEDGRARAILSDVAYLAGQFNMPGGRVRRCHGVVRCGYATNDVMQLLLVAALHS